jgi:hypothetical protein
MKGWSDTSLRKGVKFGEREACKEVIGKCKGKCEDYANHLEKSCGYWRIWFTRTFEITV